MSDATLKLALFAIKKGVRIPKGYLLQKYQDNAYLAEMLKRLDVNCVLDVGANKGQFAEKLRRMGYEGYIFSFEPIPEDYDYIAARSKSDNRWISFNYALGSKDDVKQFVVIGVESTVFSSFLDPIAEVPDGRKSIFIQVRRLDDVFSDIRRMVPDDLRIFLKMDTQGYDLEVCRGGEKIIQDVRGIQSELSVEAVYNNQPSYIEALSFYESLGFLLMNLSIVNRSGTTTGIREYDCVMARDKFL